MKKEEQKEKNLVKKAKKMRSMIMMMLLCVLMLSAATYAWFTLSNTAKISNLTMTVGEATGLQIAKDTGTGSAHTPGTYSSVLNFEDGVDPNYKITGLLLPATTTDGQTFLMPVYDEDGKVSGSKAADKHLTNATSQATDEGYYYETTFYLKALGENSIHIKLKDGATLPNTGIAENSNTATGTYVLAKNGSTKNKGYLGSQAIRISLTAGTNTLVYEPNSDVHGSSGMSAALANGVSFSPVASTSVQISTGAFSSQSKYLTLAGNTDTLVTMRIWIEGTDDDCVNEISLNDIIAQLMFEEVSTNP